MNLFPKSGVNANGYREIRINEPNHFKMFCSNSISRTKYNIFTFLPLFLFEQFRTYTNFFFLLISVIQQFPEAAFLGRYTTVFPLSIILSVSAIKEIVEDIRRAKADRIINTRLVEIFRNSKWSEIQWSEVKVGDIAKVYENNHFPADMLLVSSSFTESSICYIDTSNLDGESNLKLRSCVPRLQVQPLENFKGLVECDPPNEFIYEYKGLLHTSDGLKIPINSNHLLLRGSILKNTSWVIGVVVYTGKETKIIKNSSQTRLKRSSVSVTINRHIFVLFLIFLGFTFLHWYLYISWNNKHWKETWYMKLEHHYLFDVNSSIMILVTGVIYSIIIPISLPVMQEFSRIVQGWLISCDLDLYDKKSDMRATVKTSSLNDDLGLVKYVFADKTGTLTINQLEFRKCFVDGAVYTKKELHVFKDRLRDPSFNMLHFFTAVITGPGVIPVFKDNQLTYFTSSPDQKALLLAAKSFGITVWSRTASKAKVDVHGSIQMYDILCEFEFTSDRKRSSVIVRAPNNRIFMYVLGADDVILYLSTNEEYKRVVKDYIVNFSVEGYRSICIGMVELDETNFNLWYPTYTKAQESLYDKEGMLYKAEEMILQNITLLGCTAVEDKLQDEVPQTISSLFKAGINIWIVTGDKKETAINIGYSCHLLSHELPLIIWDTNNLQNLLVGIENFKSELGSSFGCPDAQKYLLVSGSSLKTIFDSGTSEDVNNLILAMLSCKAVICCRTTPKQKAQVVKCVQKLTKYVTLAIGDGANDVAMIQTASIGVGISGMEGRQAANAADYAISEFKMLKKLLLVHGTWSYNRIGKMVYIIYYKNFLLAFIQFIYTSQNAWSGQLYFDEWGRMMYNVLLTSLPTVTLGVLEQELPAKLLMSTPQVYSYNTWFNFNVYWRSIFNAAVHSIFLTIMPVVFLWPGVFWKSGYDDSYLVSGNIVYTGLIVVVNLKCLLHSNFWTSLTIIFVVLSIVIWIILLFLLSYAWPTIRALNVDMVRVVWMIFSTPLFYLYILLTIVTLFWYDVFVFICSVQFKEPMKTVNELRMENIKNQRKTSSFS